MSDASANTNEPTLGDILAAALTAEPAAPESPIVAAAWGDVTALRELASQAYADAKSRTGIAALFSCVEALTFARLAAAQGDRREDALNAVFLFDAAADLCRQLGNEALGDHLGARCLLLAECMAEDGDEDMGSLVVECGPAIAPAVHLEARRLREVALAE